MTKKQKREYHRKWYLKNKKSCSKCDNLISYHSDLCHSCAEKKHWDEHPEKWRKDKYCKVCSKPISKRSIHMLCRSCAIKDAYKKGRINQKGAHNSFFNKTHSEDYKNRLKELMKGKGNQNWKGGLSKLPYSFDFTEELKLKIRYRDDYKCQNCGMTEEEHLIVLGTVLIIHHIDYDKINCKEDNLITVCNACNARANYNRNYWQDFYTTKVCSL